MIKQLRLDERLIHGQITTQWSKLLDVDTIVVANDKAANDEMTKQILLMTSPAGKKVAVRTVERAIKLLSDPRSEKMKVLLIAGEPKDIPALVHGLDIHSINLGNYKKNRSAASHDLTGTLSMPREEFEPLVELSNQGIEIFAQQIPNATRYEFQELKSNFDKGE